MSGEGTIWKPVNELTQPRRVTLIRDHGTTDRTVVPCLYDQLVEAAAVSGNDAGDGGGRNCYRTPIDLDVMELAADIREATVDALVAYGLRPHDSVTGAIRQLATHLVGLAEPGDVVVWWTERFGSWVRQIKRRLNLTGDPVARRIRGASCPHCHTAHAMITGLEGPERVPPLLIEFTGPYVRCVTCSCCLATWWRGEGMVLLADALRVPPENDAAAC